MLRTEPDHLKRLGKVHGLFIGLVNPEMCSAWNFASQDSCLRVNRFKHTLTARNFDEGYALLHKIKRFLDNLVQDRETSDSKV